MKILNSSVILTFLICVNTIISFSQNKTWTCIDTNDKILFEIEAKTVRDFQDGMAGIYQQNLINNKWVSGDGFINDKGEIVIKPIYYRVSRFADGLAWVRKSKDDNYMLLNKKGEEIPTKGYQKVGAIISGSTARIAVFDESGKMGFIDRTGKEVIPCKYLGSQIFTEGLACVMPYEAITEKYGFIDTNDVAVIPFQFKQAGTSSFHNGLCRATVNGSIGFIDKTGKLVFKTKYKSLQNMNYGLSAACTKSDRTGWGFLNLKDEFVIPSKYDYVLPFNEDGLAVVELNKLQGVIDTTGKLVIPMIYESISYGLTEDGFIRCSHPSSESLSLKEEKKDYFDKNFNKVPFDGYYMLSANYSSRIPFCDKNNKMGYMDRNYNVVIPAKYSKALVFHEDKAWVQP